MSKSLARTIYSILILTLSLSCTQANPASPAQSAMPLPTLSSSQPPLTYDGSNTLNLVSHLPAPHWDVHLTPSNVLASWGPGIVYSRLLKFRSGSSIKSPSMLTECDLCTSWQQLDPVTYLFTIREDAFWHNTEPVSGRPVTGKDIEFSYTRQSTPGYPNAPLLESIKTVEAKNTGTVRITLNAPDADFLAKIASGYSKIVAHDAVAVNGHLKEGPVIGSGPWIWKGTGDGLGYVFESNPNYFEKGLPATERLNIHVITNEQTRVAAFQLGKIDILEAPSNILAQLEKDNPNISTLLYRESGTGLELSLKSNATPLDNLQMRKAIFNAMDPWTAIDSFWNGLGFVSLGMPVISEDWLLDEQELKNYLANPTKTTEFLSGGTQGLSPTFTLSIADYGDEYLAYGKYVAEELAEFGFNISTKIITQKDYPQDIWYGGNYEAFIGPMAPITTPNMYMYSVLHSRGAWNTHGYGNGDLDSLIEQQAMAMDGSLRKELAIQIQKHLMDKATRFMPISKVSAWVSWPSIKNFHPTLASAEYLYLAHIGVLD